MMVRRCNYVLEVLHLCWHLGEDILHHKLVESTTYSDSGRSLL